MQCCKQWCHFVSILRRWKIFERRWKYRLFFLPGRDISALHWGKNQWQT